MTKLIFKITVLAILISTSSYAEAKSKYCSQEQYFEEQSEYLNIIYSRAFKYTTISVYTVGKHSYNFLKGVNSISFDALAGLKAGGIKGAFINVFIGLGEEKFLQVLESFLEHPRAVSLEIANLAIKDGLNAYNENYKVYRNKQSNMNVQEYKTFINNQIKVDILGSARDLYNSVKDDQSNPFMGVDNTNIIAKVDNFFSKTLEVDKAVKAVKIIEILALDVDLNSYEPLNDYLTALNSVENKYSIGNCDDSLPVNEYNDKKVLNEHTEKDIKKTYKDINVDSCIGDSRVNCRDYCYKLCDRNSDKIIQSTKIEMGCYQQCTKQCKKECDEYEQIKKLKKESDIIKNYNVSTGDLIKIDILVICDGIKKPGNAGIVITDNNNSKLSCSMNNLKKSTFGKCLVRQVFPSKPDAVSEVYDIKSNKKNNLFVSFYNNLNKSCKLHDGNIFLPPKKNRSYMQKIIKNEFNPGETPIFNMHYQ